MVMTSLDGRAVVVTGAGQGLGRAFATHLAQVGAAVVVNDIDRDLAESTVDAIESAGGCAVVSDHSVADAEQAQAIVDLCVREYGQIDGLVNNAGVSYEALPADEDPRLAHELIQVNVLGVIYTGLAAVRAMAGRRGSIVNISSGASLGQRMLGTYAASKGAVASLTYSWALDLEAARIRVNAVCPLAHTRMVRSSERALRNCPPDRTPEMVAPLVSFLISDLSLGVTGQMIRCNGPQLHLVGQPYLKSPILERDSWDSDSVERAFSEVFHAHLEPYGLEKRLPPMLRKWLSWHDDAERTVRS
ncbi:MAG: SDR family NAD(P)-dependent oxidoreductase [Actinophytocola sp.]|uniref:SDR family NAD(P)-dependent oxidoreductase n=1 Tax=Actinophytocola sp. TaxID=1872138 RepID=UPI0013232D84|nr:SDR family oxidoreductase [Actinophytocola sp.]MPZ84850.1 SDR family NAD(P)-dependent oxidoreductase [Actinophytocola sp.]